MAHSRMDRVANGVLLVAPAAWLTFFCIFVARAYFEVGHLPTYSNPDPKSLGMGVHHGLLWLSLYLLPWLILGYGVTRLKEKFSAWKAFGLFTLLASGLFTIVDSRLLVHSVIRAMPLISLVAFVATRAKKSVAQRVWWGYGISLLILNIWICVDPFGMMEWFFD